MNLINIVKEKCGEDVSIVSSKYFESDKKIRILLKNCKEENKIKIEKFIKNKFKFIEIVEIIKVHDGKDIGILEINKEHFLNILNISFKDMPLIKKQIESANRYVEEEILYIELPNEFIKKMFKDRNISEKIKKTCLDIYGLNIKIEFKVPKDSNIKMSDFETKESIESLNEFKTKFKEKEKEKENVKIKKKTKSSVKYTKNENDDAIIMGKTIKEVNTEIGELENGLGIVAICGEIFKSDVIETRTGRKIVTFMITDKTGSIQVKVFPREKDMDSVLNNVQKGLYCEVRGEVQFDNYANEIVIFAKDIIKATKSEKGDFETNKRVELHAHTNMSSMDGVTNVKKLIERASKWGHKAIAITDHGVVQSFPDAMEASFKNKIKVIYGVEAYIVDDSVNITENYSDRNLQDISLDDEFVVFDFETTGFSPTNDKIIEIGAVLVKNGEIIDNFSTYINPEVSLKNRIVELTKITDKDLKNAPKIEQKILEFLNFTKGRVLVAHNAKFDYSFLKKNANDSGYKVENPLLDTITLSKFVYKDIKTYKLNTVAKHVGVKLLNHHRAIDDAKATAGILIHAFNKLKEIGITNLKELNQINSKELDVKKLSYKHAIILVKNQIGIKNLYKLISISHLKYFHKKPLMPKSLINEMREGLIIGSACEAGEVFKSFIEGDSFDKKKQIASFYDYLEIQPIPNNLFLINKGIVKSEKELQNINLDIVKLGDELNIPVVATCDIHFLDPEDEVFRRILMAGQGYSDTSTQPPLYFRNTSEMLKEFEYLGDRRDEIVIHNPNKISDMIEEILPIPKETFPPKIEGSDTEIREMTYNNAREIYGENLPDIVEKRIEKELNSIISNGYAVLYLIAHKLVDKSLKDGYLVGSRGSVGSSLVATFCNITEVNGLAPHYICKKCKNTEFILDGSYNCGIDLPDKDCPVCGNKYDKEGHDIPFETFLGFEGDKEPDIDLNFSGEYQAVVHKYTEELFGEGYVFKAGTIGTIADKTAYGFVKKYLDAENRNERSAEIQRLTDGCTGVKRSTGQHPGGIMVVPSDNEIYNFTPIQRPANDNESDVITTHFDYHSISGRLLKLDILGHDDPTFLRMLQDITGLDPKSIPLDDKKVLSLFLRPDALGVTSEELKCETGSYGIPEFGTKFVRQMLVDTKPQTFSDLVRISGLSHGTEVWINNAQYFIKEGKTTLKDCISTRDDIMVYLMYKGLEPKKAFNIMESVRKGKGLKEEDEKLMEEKDVPEWYIESCKRIKYMFPKGHAVAYVTMAIRIAYFKVYYPLAYYATYFTVRASDFDGDLVSKGKNVIDDKIQELYSLGNNISVKEKGLLTVLEICFEMCTRGFDFLPVDLYKSHDKKFIIEGNSLRLPLSSLEGVGENIAKAISLARDDRDFISIDDLKQRSKATKTAIEALANHGVLSHLPETNQLSFF